MRPLNIKFIKYVTSDLKICTCTYYVNLPSLYVTLRNYRVTFLRAVYLKSSDKYAKIWAKIYIDMPKT